MPAMQRYTLVTLVIPFQISNPLLRKLKTTFLSHPDLRKGNDPYGFLSRDIRCGDARLGNRTKVWQGNDGFLLLDPAFPPGFGDPGQRKHEPWTDLFAFGSPETE